MFVLMAPLWPYAGPLTAAAARLGRAGAVEGLWLIQASGSDRPSSDGQHRGHRLRQLKGAAALAPAPAPAEGAARLHIPQNSSDMFLHSIKVLHVGVAAGGRPIPMQIGH